MGKRTIFLVLTLISVTVVVAWGLVSLGEGSAAATEASMFAVRMGDLRISITENGVLQAKNSAKVVTMAQRQGKIVNVVEEGKSVEEGETLAQLDTTPLKEQLQELEMEVVKTEADLNTARTELTIQKSENAANIEKTTMALAKAKKEYERYSDGDAPKERVKLQIAIKEVQSELRIAEDKFKQTTKLSVKGFASGSELQRDEIKYAQARDKIKVAQRDLEIFESFSFPMMLTDKKTAIKDAKRAHDNANLRASAKLRQREVAVESQEQRLKSLHRQIDKLKEDIGYFSLKAPVPGVVIYGDPARRWYRQYVKIGADVWGGMTLFTIPDLRVMQVRVQVHETDIDKLKVGQRATVTMETYSGLFLKGKVTQIANLASGESNDPNADEVRNFTVYIDLDSTEDRDLKPGVSAKAVIFIEDVHDALYVPAQCVFEEDDAVNVLVTDDAGAPQRRVVQIGASNEQYVQITSGLQEGEKVLLYNPALPSGSPAAPALEPAQAATPAIAVSSNRKE